MKCKECGLDVFGAKIQKGTGMCKKCWEEMPVLIVEEVPKKSFLRRLFHR